MLRKLAVCLVLVGASIAPALPQVSTFYTYDALGRLTRVDRPSNAVTYTYDPADNRSNVTSVNPYATYWEAEALFHNTGYAQGDAWVAGGPGVPSNHMIYGPYTTGVPTGNRVAAFRMALDVPSNPSPDDQIVVIDVYNATAGQLLASEIIQRKRWALPLTYQTFELPFTLSAGQVGHMLEFRVYYIGHSYILVDKVGYR